MSIKILLLYLATWTLVALTPGPAVMCSMAQATRHGFRASLAGISGIQAGNLLYFVCIALGLGTLLATATAVFNLLRIAGAVYLLYLGARAIIGTFRHSPPAVKSKEISPASHHGLFVHGFLIQLTNPKALLFVSALLPQFIDPRRPAATQLILLGAMTILVDAVVLSSYAFLAERGGRSARLAGLKRWFERVYGAALIFFGLRLFASKK